MTDLFDRLSNLEPKRLALLVMDLQAKLEEAERRHAEPVAIISMACRLPGAQTPCQPPAPKPGTVSPIVRIPGSNSCGVGVATASARSLPDLM